MPKFLASAACKGRRPEGAAAERPLSRPDLAARLLRERDVARFLVAPSGFGKSTLMAEYAETMFGFSHVFWINGRSPCFLRDLDAGTMALQLQELDAQPFLAAFDDLPPMDAARADEFSRVVDDLLLAGNEVMAACTPMRDAFGERHRDRLKLSAADLLLSAEESEADSGEAPGREGRIACLCWGSDDGSALLRSFAAEELPSSVLLAAFCLAAIGEGSLRELESVLPAPIVQETSAILEEGYPFFGVNTRTETFQAIDVDVQTIARAFAPSLGRLADRSLLEGPQALIMRIGDMLLSRKKEERACAMLRELAGKGACAEWLLKRGSELSRAGCAKPAHDLFAFAGRGTATQRAQLELDEAFRLAMLEDAEGCVRLASKRAFAPATETAPRLNALLAVFRNGSAPESERALSILRLLVKQPHPRMTPRWMPLARIASACRDGGACGARTWEKLADEGCDADALAVAAAWVLEALVNDAAPANDTAEGAAEENDEGRGGSDAATGTQAVTLRIGLWAKSQLDASASDEAALPLTLLHKRLDTAIEQGVMPPAAASSPEAAERTRRMELSLFAQRAAYRKETEARCPETDGRRGESKAPGSNVGRKTGAPPLFITLFGGMDVKIGGETVDPRLLNRRKTKTLLALLTLARGREVPRDYLLQTLWPYSDPAAARKNFYTVWSQLTHALSFQGSCPYLIRNQTGCRLDARLVTSDVAQFETLCRSLSFGKMASSEWEATLELVAEAYSEDLLPGEHSSELIEHLRDDFRVNLVDALLAGSTRLLEDDEAQGALWFAREALRRDKAREDAYHCMMQAQLAAGRRSAAIETYFQCRAHLVEKLGIDPSSSVVRLYREALESEELLE